MGRPQIVADQFLLDTCVLIWWAAGEKKKISEPIRQAVGNPTAAVSVGSISVAEIARLAERRRIQLTSHWKIWFRQAAASNGWSVLPATWEIMEEAYSLPDPFHGDPADRILVATARLHRLALVTPDERILKYPHVDTLW